MITYMPERMSTSQRLLSADGLRRRVEAGESQDAVARAEAMSTPAVAKAVWLSRRFGPESRGLVGTAIESVSVSHIEAVAALDPATGARLLRRAAAERIPVRALKGLVAEARRAGGKRSVDALGGAVDLISAKRAVECYCRLDQRALGTLLTGPNGTLISGLVDASQKLGDRIAEGGALR